MSKQHDTESSYGSAETGDTSTSTRKMEETAQVTVKDTGWTEEEKERMKQHGYDSLDMVRAWYS